MPIRLSLSLCVNEIPVLYFFYVVSACAQETFTFSENGTVCIKAMFDAVFELSLTDENGTVSFT